MHDILHQASPLSCDLAKVGFEALIVSDVRRENVLQSCRYKDEEE
jgi:hypothetical protein